MNAITIHTPLIYTVRGIPVMLDQDVSRLYKTTTRLVNLARKRKIDVLGSLSFKLTKKEFHQLVKEHGLKISNSYNPIAYTEEGCYKLASYLNSPVADQMTDIMYKAFKAVKDNKIIIVDKNPQISELSKEIIKINEKMQGFNQPVINNYFQAPVNYIQGSHNVQNIQQISNSNDLIKSIIDLMREDQVIQNKEIMDEFIKALDLANKKEKDGLLERLGKIVNLGSSVASLVTGVPNLIEIVKKIFP